MLNKQFMDLFKPHTLNNSKNNSNVYDLFKDFYNRVRFFIKFTKEENVLRKKVETLVKDMPLELEDKVGYSYYIRQAKNRMIYNPLQIHKTNVDRESTKLEQYAMYEYSGKVNIDGNFQDLTPKLAKYFFKKLENTATHYGMHHTYVRC